MHEFLVRITQKLAGLQ